MNCSINGVPVHYRQLGEGRPIVMLHGWPSDHRLARYHMEPVFARRPGWRRLYPDLPGMGRTPGHPSVASVDDMLDLVLEFVDHVAKGERFGVVGVSFGGYLARGILARRGSQLDGVMLWTPSVHMGRVSRRLPERRVLVRDPIAIADVAQDEQPWLGVSVAQTPATLAAFRAAVMPGLRLADWPALGRVGERPVLSARNLDLDRPFDGPSLVITGRQDHMCGYLDAWDLNESLTRATFAVLDGGGHAVAEERQRLFRALVADWLERMSDVAEP